MTTKLEIQKQTFDIDHFQFTPTALSTDTIVDFAEWERVGQFIRLTNAASQWWWGDWLNLGENTFGEKSSQALEVTKWDEKTLRVYAWVCRQVPPAKRVTGVSFSHYILLAKLPEDKQVEWAEQVVENDWSQRQLRKALRNANTSNASMQPCVLVRCNDEKEASTVKAWARKNKLEAEGCERARK